MALTPEQIATDLIGTPESHPFRHLMVEVVRKVMAEVRKDDDALIRKLVEALEGYRRNHNDGQPCDAEKAGRARLEKAP